MSRLAGVTGVFTIEADVPFIATDRFNIHGATFRDIDLPGHVVR